MKVEAPKKLEAQETNQIGSAVKKREAQWRRVDSMHAVNLLLIEIFVHAKWSRIEILNQLKSHPSTHQPPDGFILDRGRIPEIRARIEEEAKSSGKGWLRYQIQEGGIPQSKDKSKWNESYKKFDEEEISKS